jgi:two-component sensor histidine kinase
LGVDFEAIKLEVDSAVTVCLIINELVLNAEKIEGFNQHSVLVNGKTIPISKSNREEVLERFRRV